MTHDKQISRVEDDYLYSRISFEFLVFIDDETITITINRNRTNLNNCTIIPTFANRIIVKQ